MRPAPAGGGAEGYASASPPILALLIDSGLVGSTDFPPRPCSRPVHSLPHPLSHTRTHTLCLALSQTHTHSHTHTLRRAPQYLAPRPRHLAANWGAPGYARSLSLLSLTLSHTLSLSLSPLSPLVSPSLSHAHSLWGAPGYARSLSLSHTHSPWGTPGYARSLSRLSQTLSLYGARLGLPALSPRIRVRRRVRVVRRALR